MKTCLWLLLLLNSWGLLAQPFASRNLSIQQGLPEYYVSGLVQDKAGFVWIATRDGLARYDGRSFKIFRHQPHGDRSMANNIIVSLQPVSDTTMLIQFEDDGFQRFNPLTEQFSDLLSEQQLVNQHILKPPQARLMPDGRRLWLRQANQLILYQSQPNTFARYPFLSITLPKDVSFGNSFVLDFPATIYAPYPGGLLAFNSQTGRFQQWANPAIVEHGAIHVYLETPIIRRATGELLIGGVRQLIGFNPKTGRFRSILLPHALDTKIGIMHAGVDGNVYFTHALTVYRLSPDDRLTPLWTAARLDYQNYFHALLLDRSGVLWVGTNGDGVQQIDLHALPINTYPYRTNFVHDVLTKELGMQPPTWARISDIHYRFRWGGDAAYATARYNHHYHLLRLDHSTRKLLTLVDRPPGPKNPLHPEGNGLRVLPNGTIWMMDNQKSLLKADASGHILDEFALPNDRVSDLQPLGNWIWIGSEVNGLYAFDPRTRRIVRRLHYVATDSTSLLSNRVWCLAADPNDPAVLWVGTQEGLGRLDTRTMRFKNWTQQQGLPNATIQTLLTDRQGQLWFSTLKGISRLNPRRGQMRHYTTADGLLDTEYKSFSGVQLPDGRLAFGGLTGVTTFDPAALKEADMQPIPTVLTALKLNNVVVEPGQQNSPLAVPLQATSTLRLKPTQNFLSLEFAGLQYNKPASLRYRYQLTGVDPDWVYVGSQNLANYTQLQPGDYAFRVNTADAAGHWSPLIKTIRIIVDPPWWQTGWAYGLYVLLVAGLVGAYIQYRISRAQLRQEVMLKEQEARLSKQHADWQTRFFTNITHEFRTPLTLILGPLERLMEPSTRLSRESLGQQYGVMHRNAGRLLRLINQLLDIAKLEAGQMALTESQGNLPAFFAQLVESFRPRAEKKGVKVAYHSSGLRADYRFDAQKLETIAYNLLANAVNFTDSGGQIQVSLSEERLPDGQSGCRLRVTDTGCGIAPEQLPRIFDRFFQVATAEASTGQGTGIGLFLVAELSKLLGGDVMVESQLGQGTTFSVTLPLRQADGSGPVVEPLSIEAVGYPESAVEPSMAPATAPLVLVVEDNDELREFVAGELAGTYRVLTAANGQAGWQLCLAELPELVISDVMMPVVDGFTLVERIKTTPLTAHIAVILLTAKTMTDSRIQGLSVGANDYLTKPFNVAELTLRIANLLGHQQQLRQHWQEQSRQLDTSPAPGLPSEPAAEDPFLRQTYQVLDNQLANSGFTIEQLADELAVSHRTLNRKLVALTGLNARDLLRAYRLRKAVVFLQQGCSVSEAAEKTGFDGLSYFGKSFKAQFAVSPSAYLVSRRGN